MTVILQQTVDITNTSLWSECIVYYIHTTAFVKCTSHCRLHSKTALIFCITMATMLFSVKWNSYSNSSNTLNINISLYGQDQVKSIGKTFNWNFCYRRPQWAEVLMRWKYLWKIQWQIFNCVHLCSCHVSSQPKHEWMVPLPSFSSTSVFFNSPELQTLSRNISGKQFAPYCLLTQAEITEGLSSVFSLKHYTFHDDALYKSTFYLLLLTLLHCLSFKLVNFSNLWKNIKGLFLKTVHSDSKHCHIVIFNNLALFHISRPSIIICK